MRIVRSLPIDRSLCAAAGALYKRCRQLNRKAFGQSSDTMQSATLSCATEPLRVCQQRVHAGFGRKGAPLGVHCSFEEDPSLARYSTHHPLKNAVQHTRHILLRTTVAAALYVLAGLEDTVKCHRTCVHNASNSSYREPAKTTNAVDW